VADPSRHHFARQQQRNKRTDQAAGEHLGQHLAEQRYIAQQDGEEVFTPIARIDSRSRCDGQHGDDCR